MYFFLSLPLYEYMYVRTHACVCVCVHNGVGFHFWGTGIYELDCDIPVGRIVLRPSCVPEKASVNQKGVNKKWRSHNK